MISATSTSAPATCMTWSTKATRIGRVIDPEPGRPSAQVAEAVRMGGADISKSPSALEGRAQRLDLILFLSGFGGERGRRRPGQRGPADGVELKLQTKAGEQVNLAVVDRSSGLPTIPGTNFAPRPADSMPQHSGDQTMVRRTFTF